MQVANKPGSMFEVSALKGWDPIVNYPSDAQSQEVDDLLRHDLERVCVLRFVTESTVPFRAFVRALLVSHALRYCLVTDFFRWTQQRIEPTYPSLRRRPHRLVVAGVLVVLVHPMGTCSRLDRKCSKRIPMAMQRTGREHADRCRGNSSIKTLTPPTKRTIEVVAAVSTLSTSSERWTACSYAG